MYSYKKAMKRDSKYFGYHREELFGVPTDLFIRLHWERPLQRQGIESYFRTCRGLYCEI